MDSIAGFSTGISGQVTQNILANQTKLTDALHQLSAGIRLNSPADGPADFAQASNVQIAAMAHDAAADNSQQAAQAFNLAAEAISTIEGIVQKLRSISVAAASTTLSAQDRSVLQTQASGYTAEINTIASQTQFRGMQLIGMNPVSAMGTTTTAAATPTVVQSGTGTTGNYNTPNLTISLAQAPTAGNVLVAMVTYGNGFGGNQTAQTLTTPAGWTLVTSVNDNQYYGTEIYTHVAAAGDPSAYTFTGALRGDEGTGTIVEIAGADTTNPVAAAAATSTNVSAAGTFVSPALTASTAAELPLAIFAFHFLPQSGTGSAPAPAGSWQGLTTVNNTYISSETQFGAAPAPSGIAQTGYYMTANEVGNEVQSAAILIQGVASGQTATTAQQPAKSIVVGGASEGNVFSAPLPSLGAQSLGLTNIDLSTAAGATAAIGTSDAALSTLSQAYTTIASMQRNLQTDGDLNTLESVDLAQYGAGIRDSDTAQDLTDVTRGKLITNLDTKLLSGAKTLAKATLSLLEDGIHSTTETGTGMITDRSSGTKSSPMP